MLLLFYFVLLVSVPFSRSEDGPFHTPADDINPRFTMSKLEAFVTNDRYQNPDVVWGKPKGILYGNIPGAGQDQKANLYPDRSSTYNVANVRLPKGSYAILQGQYPHARYLSFTIANHLGDEGHLGSGVFLRGDQIVPDVGNQNPFLPGADRKITNRNYTIYIVQGSPPANGVAPNTLYTGITSDDRIHLSMRSYLADRGYDGNGVIPLNGSTVNRSGIPEWTLVLPGNETLSGAALLDALQPLKNGDPPGYELKHWLYLIAKSEDPENAPCLKVPACEIFWNTDYSVTGAFQATDPEQRVIDHPANTDGGFANNPDTVYLMVPYSFGHNEVLVLRGKMPTHPNTRQGNPTLPSEPTMLQYFSISTATAPSSGAGWDTVVDEEIPLDEHGYYTIVVSWPWNRPAMATLQNNVTWLSPGGGEGNYVGARNWVGAVYFRFQNCNPDWKHSPQHVPVPTPENPLPQEPLIMGPYYPVAEYAARNWQPGSLGDGASQK